MPQEIRFENHFAKRVMEIFFDDGFELATKADVDTLKQRWSHNLKQWHAPYTCIIDCRALRIAPEQEQEFRRLIEFFGKFFMKKIVGFREHGSGSDSPANYPFPVFDDYDSAIAETGLGRSGGLKKDLVRLRDRIQIDSDFAAHVMEVSFLAPTTFETAADVLTLREKLQNILMQWHTPYSLVFNVENCGCSDEARTAFAALERFLRGFFCQAIIGYGPVEDPSQFPFQVFRSRHRAVGMLENQGLRSGDAAHCGPKFERKT